jgi:hypothetical protein
MAASDSSSAYRGRPHPDDKENHKHKLICSGVEELSKQFPSLPVFLWIDFTCLNQDYELTSQIKDFDMLIKRCDALFTPIYDDKDGSWELTLTDKGYLHDYKAEAFNGEGQLAYLSRAWCRTEMLYATTLPMNESSLQLAHVSKFTRGPMKHGLTSHLRPHFIYGSRECRLGLSPIPLPPLQHYFFYKFRPIEGFVTVEGDKTKIAALVKDLRTSGFSHKVTIGWNGVSDSSGTHTLENKYLLFIPSNYLIMRLVQANPLERECLHTTMAMYTLGRLSEGPDKGWVR